MTSNDELWTIEDIARFLKMSKSALYRNWRNMGIKPIIAYPGAKPRFAKSAVMKALEVMK